MGYHQTRLPLQQSLTEQLTQAPMKSRFLRIWQQYNEGEPHQTVECLIAIPNVVIESALEHVQLILGQLPARLVARASVRQPDGLRVADKIQRACGDAEQFGQALELRENER
jgi:hypothetical protein